jgi:hypothetical protein
MGIHRETDSGTRGATTDPTVLARGAERPTEAGVPMGTPASWCRSVRIRPVGQSTMVTFTSMLPRVALEYGQTWWAASAISWRRSGATFGR